MVIDVQDDVQDAGSAGEDGYKAGSSMGAYRRDLAK